MSQHLSDEQLSAHLDGALTGAAAAAAATHLDGCEACRARLGDAATLDAGLERSLVHDPGEAYFASFADRVSARIASDARAAAASSSAAARAGGWRAWLRGPRGLALAGSALALVVVGALGVQLMRSHGVSEFASSQASRALLRQQAPPAPAASAPQPSADAAPPTSGDDALMSPMVESRKQAAANALAPAPSALKDREAGHALVAPGRAMEMKTLENGEQVPVAPRGGPSVLDRRDQGEPRPGTSPLSAMRRAEPMAPRAFAPAPVEAKAKAVAQDQAVAGSRANEVSAGALQKTEAARDLAAAAPAAALARVSGGAQPAREADALAALAHVCGQVVDARGRPVPNASVAIAQTGAATSTDPQGGFCLDAPAGATLRVLAMGFEPAAQAVDPHASQQRVQLVSVQTLAPGLGSGFAGLHMAGPPNTLDPFAGVSTQGRTLLTAAQRAETAAGRAKRSEAWARAAQAWSRAAGASDGTAASECRYRAAAARMQALRLPKAPAHASVDAKVAVDAFLAQAPDGAERDLALRWQSELAK